MNNLTEDQIETLKKLEKTIQNHDKESCRVDCCIICYIEETKKDEKK